MAITPLVQPVNNFQTILAAPHAAGDGQLVLRAGDGARLGALPANRFYKITAVANPGPSETILGIFKATGRSGDTLTGVVAEEGYGDGPLAAGTVLQYRLTAQDTAQAQDAISALEALETTTVYTTGSYASPAWLTSIPGTIVTGDIPGKASGLTAAIAESQVTNLSSDLALKAPLASPTFIGTPTAPTPATADNSTTLATTAYVKAQGYLTTNAVASVFGRTGVVVKQAGDYAVGDVTGAAPLASPTFTGTPAAPTAAVDTNTTQLATTAYVVGQGYAKLASPAFTGTPTAPTPATADNSTTLATTAYVKAQGYAPLASPTFTGTPSLPTGTTGVTQSAADNSTKLATTAYVDAADNLKAPLASPALTGTPTAPTAAPGTNTTQLATTAFVLANAGGGGGAVSSVFGRTGAVVAASGDYAVAQVTGAAPLASPSFTGVASIPASYGTITADSDAATVTFDMSASNRHSLLTTSGVGANRTLAVSNVQVGQDFRIAIKQAASGGPYTVTWFSGISWAGGIVPPLSTGANKTDVFVFNCIAAGTYLGAACALGC